MTGYDALHEGAAWLDVSARGRIRVSGEDRARLLHAMTTNHIQQLAPGDGCYAFFLSAQGRILADANILCRPDHFLLDTEPETTEKLYGHLDRFIIADDVTLEDITAQTGAIAVEGPRSGDILRVAGVPTPEVEYADESWGECLVAKVSLTGAPGWLLIGPASERDALAAQLGRAGATAASREDFRMVRIEMGRPRYVEDIGERNLAQETNQYRAIHFQKGCYLGQEIVERVRARGQLHRTLMPVRIEGESVPEAGTKLQAGGHDAGEITSAVWSPRQRAVVALAYVRTEDVRPGGELDLDGRRAVIL